MKATSCSEQLVNGGPSLDAANISPTSMGCRDHGLKRVKTARWVGERSLATALVVLECLLYPHFHGWARVCVRVCGFPLTRFPPAWVRDHDMQEIRLGLAQGMEGGGKGLVETRTAADLRTQVPTELTKRMAFDCGVGCASRDRGGR